MRAKIDKVLIALKPWQGGLPISAYHGRLLAQRLGAKLRLLSCVYDSQIAVGALRRDPEALAAQVGLVESEGAVIAELAESVRDWGIDVECDVRWGHPPEDVILAEIERWGADLLVIGTHQPGARPHTRLAQVDWQLMRSCPCPILVARDPRFRGYTSVVAAVDPLHRHAEPERLDRRILEIATRLTASAEARLKVVHVRPSAESFALASSIEVSPGVYYGSENIEHIHRQALNELVAEFGIRRTSAILLDGDPAEQLADYIRDQRVDLVVLGALKRGALEEWVLGSTAERIVAEVGCDVLLVKPDD